MTPPLALTPCSKAYPLPSDRRATASCGGVRSCSCGRRGCRGDGPEAAKMSNEPPPPYPGGPTAPLLEEKSGAPPTPGRTSPAVMQPPPGMSMPPADIGPPPYEPPGHPMPQPGFIPPHVNADGTYMPPGFYPPPGPHPPMGYYPPGPYPPGPYSGPGGHTATVLVPSGAATTVTVLQGEIFEGAPVQTVCPHCQQAITTKISYEIGLMNFVLGFFCCFMGCDLGCCLIPCLINDFKDVTHTCPSCKAYIYTYKRLC
uniref:cell death-inducing p53-target protein 1 isoform X2 n=1 Tax=Halichoerus grypus TaxID=9711 RepID=UPI001658FC6C|nr:cell death-inducing p53-target protein 1 isoform X2 [Halichoerus grypus]